MQKICCSKLSILALVVVSLVFGASGYAQSFSVDGVTIEGNRRIDSEAVKAQLKNTKGTVTQQQISEDVKTLYRTGYFDQVSASIVKDASGHTKIKYALVEKPAVRKMFIRGNKAISESDLGEVLKLDAKRFLDRGKIDQLIHIATSYYQVKGYYDASFEYSVVPSGDNQVDLTFTVTEGNRYKIREVAIHGLTEVDEDEALDSIETKSYTWYSSWITGSGRLNAEMLENDRNLLRQFFIDHGYIDASVSSPSIDKREDGLYIAFDASEGKQYKIGKVSASGDLIDDSVEKTIEGTIGEPGEVFSASTIRNDSFAISEKFSDRGFAFANVVPDTDVDRNAAEVNMNYQVSKGDLVTVNRINISGNDKTYDHVIRRELKIGERAQYSGTKIKRSKVLLERLGYFDEVSITSKPSDKKDEVDLDVKVREASTGSFSIGAGYSSSDGALFNARISENNLFGTGKRVSVNVDRGTQRDNFIISYYDRRFYDSYWSLGLDGQITDRDFDDFTRGLNGPSISVGYPLEEGLGEWAQDINFSLKYAYMNIDIYDITDNAAQFIKDSEGKSTASAVTPRLIRSTINNPINPTKGSEQEMEFEIAGPGGDQEYWLLDFRHQMYEPLFELGNGKVVFSWRFKLGYGESRNDDPFPLFRRYFPGGINSVRGYKSRSMGPADANGSEYGGSKQLINNFEVIFPLVESSGFRGVIFFDAGEAFDDNQHIAIDDLRKAYGFGIRWMSPMGPIRVEFGFPMDKDETDDSMQTMFSFGAPM